MSPLKLREEVSLTSRIKTYVAWSLNVEILKVTYIHIKVSV